VANSALILLLEGAVQSWGTRSRWDVRDSGLEPTKSGVIGLIGCAMGLRRNDPELERLDRTLLFGVRADRPGVISTDFHTVTGYHRTAAGGFKHSGGVAKKLAKAREHGENTIVSHRDYIHDAAFLVALTVKPEHRAGNRDLLDRIQQCLQNPCWPLYLGRKSCVPSRPVFDKVIDKYKDLEAALKNEPWAATEWQKLKPPPHLEAWVECPDGDRERQDAIRHNQLRFYDFRRCKRLSIKTEGLPRRNTEIETEELNRRDE